jgi:hypothetical protein
MTLLFMPFFFARSRSFPSLPVQRFVQILDGLDEMRLPEERGRVRPPVETRVRIIACHWTRDAAPHVDPDQRLTRARGYSRP